VCTQAITPTEYKYFNPLTLNDVYKISFRPSVFVGLRACALRALGGYGSVLGTNSVFGMHPLLRHKHPTKFPKQG